MPAPAQGAELHIDGPLSNLIVGRRPEGFIADLLLPVTPVSKQSDLYYKFNYRENLLYQAGLSERAPGTEARKVVMSVASDTYYAKNYALGADMVVEDVVNADDVLQWRQSNAEMLMDRLMLDYEMRIAQLCNQATAVGTTTHVASAWTDPQVARIFDDIENYKELFRATTGKRPNTMVLPQGVWTYVRRNEQLRGRIFGQNNGGVPTIEQFANLIEIPKVLVPFSQVNTADEYSTALGSGTLADVWGKKVWIAHTQLLKGRQVDTWLNAFRWQSPLFPTPFAVQAYPYDAKKKKFEIEVGYYQAEKVVSPDLAIAVDSVA